MPRGICRELAQFLSACDRCVPLLGGMVGWVTGAGRDMGVKGRLINLYCNVEHDTRGETVRTRELGGFAMENRFETTHAFWPAASLLVRDGSTGVQGSRMSGSRLHVIPWHQSLLQSVCDYLLTQYHIFVKTQD